MNQPGPNWGYFLKYLLQFIHAKWLLKLKENNSTTVVPSKCGKFMN